MKHLLTKSRLTLVLLAAALSYGFFAGCGSSIVSGSSNATTLTPSSNSAYLAAIKIGTTQGKTISPTFMGLSHEWGTAQTMLGDSTTGTNSIYRQLLQNLTAYGSGPLNLRIGGNSTDKTGEPTSTTVLPFAELAAALDVHFMLGVNLGANNVNLAVDQAKAYISQMPAGSLDALEIGNEPDLYGKTGMRTAPYTYQNYLTDFDTWKASIAPLLPSGTQLMGASWASTGMLSNIQSYDSTQAKALANFSHHYYVGNGQADISDDILLKPSSATNGPKAVAAAVNTTHRYGTLFRMGEMNSLYNGGKEGISDAFGAALWAIDTMFEYVNVGVDGVNWHLGNGGSYAAFSFGIHSTDAGTTYTLNSVRPLYYGLLFFQAATGNGSHLLPVSLSTDANLSAWATADAAGTRRLVVINKDKSLSGTVAMTLSGYSHAKVYRLSAPSYQSKTGVTFAGQTFDGSISGKLKGTQIIESINEADGVFQLSMPVTSAALIVFSK
jgi:hypothetical protein